MKLRDFDVGLVMNGWIGRWFEEIRCRLLIACAKTGKVWLELDSDKRNLIV